MQDGSRGTGIVFVLKDGVRSHENQGQALRLKPCTLEEVMRREHLGKPGLRSTEHLGAFEAERRAREGSGNNSSGPEGGLQQGLCSFFKGFRAVLF